MSDNMFTVCLVCHGDYPDRSVKALKSIASNYGKNFSLTVCANACGSCTLEHIDVHRRGGLIDLAIISSENKHKDPMIRLARESCTTPFMLTLDDDMVMAAPDWNIAVAEFIEANYDMAGAGSVWTYPVISYEDYIVHRPWNIVSAADYYAGHPGGNMTFFAGCAVIYSTEIMRKFDFPDRGMRIKHDDIMFGELLRQHKLKMVSFSQKLMRLVPHTGVRPRTWVDNGGVDAA